MGKAVKFCEIALAGRGQGRNCLGGNLCLLMKNGDIIICRDGNHPALFYLEAKLYKESNGRIGVGEADGGGIQPEIIVKAPKYLEQHLLWVLAEGREAEPTFVVATTGELSNFIMGGEISRKQNNIQRRILDEVPRLNGNALLQRLCVWLSP